MKKTSIYYVEDEPSLGRIVSDTLEKQGYDVTWEKDGAKVLSCFKDHVPDICVLDIMLPNIDGYSLCRSIRSLYPDLPVIFLTARTETSDLINGFESGGTDYIRKPFSIEELIARIENQLNLARGRIVPPETQSCISIGKFSLDMARYELLTPSGAVTLSGRDMQVLKLLYAGRNSVIPRKELLLSVWGDDSYFNSRNLDVYIRKLRNYFSEDPSIKILTLKGNGYLFLIPE
ncbi:MAG TPA: response regulator transcription factor [Bacteroidales bacterium]|jgi:DNA-binding response OmpR family regulator|nr:response regulator transcription factor [Bacteroidales bacterium]